MNSGSDNSANDYQYMEDRLKEICEVHEVLCRNGRKSTNSSSVMLKSFRKVSSSNSQLSWRHSRQS